MESLFLVGFLKLSLEMVYPTIGLDGKRYEKIWKDGNQLQPIGEYGFSCVANTHVLLNCSFPYECVCIAAFEQKKEREANVYIHSH